MSEQEREERIKELMDVANMTRAYAAFVVAQEAGEIEGDVIFGEGIDEDS